MGAVVLAPGTNVEDAVSPAKMDMHAEGRDAGADARLCVHPPSRAQAFVHHLQTSLMPYAIPVFIRVLPAYARHRTGPRVGPARC